MSWNLQKINNGGNTSGPATVQIPFVSIYNGQQHIGYRDNSGNIWDLWYDPHSNKWNLQRINNGGNTTGPIAVEGPFIGVYRNQQHFAYIDNAGNLWDSWYDGSGHWNLQKINNGGNTTGPAAKFGSWANWVSIWVDYTDTQQHFTYLGTDLAIYDAFWDSNSNSWHLQKINSGGNTSGPPASSSPEGCIFHQQQHIGYQGANGAIMDSWYDGSGHWNLQKINNGGNTAGSSALPDTRPFIWVDYSNTQQHFTYLGADRAIYDAFWDSNSNSWHLQKINSGGNTSGPASVGAPFVSVFNRQQHIGYRDEAGNLWDSWYDGSGHWNLQKINNGGMTSGPNASHDAFIWVWNSQQHFTYVDAGGTIWDSWWDGASPSEIKVTPTSISWSHEVDLEGLDVGSIRGPVGLTVTSNGNYNFTGQLNNSAYLPYNFSVLVVLKSKSGTVFSFAVTGGIGAGIPLSNNNYQWDNNGNNGTIKDLWADLEAGCSIQYRSAANTDISTLWNDIQTVIGVVEKVVAVVGSLAA